MAAIRTMIRAAVSPSASQCQRNRTGTKGGRRGWEALSTVCFRFHRPWPGFIELSFDWKPRDFCTEVKRVLWSMIKEEKNWLFRQKYSFRILFDTGTKTFHPPPLLFSEFGRKISTRISDSRSAKFSQPVLISRLGRRSSLNGLSFPRLFTL